jgi:hypothetical protein
MSHSKRFVLTVSLIAAVLLAPATSFAQNVASTNDWAALRNIPSDSKVIVKLKTGKSVDGKLLSVSDSSITLSRNNSSLDMKREEVKSVHQIIKKSATAGTLIGLGVGAGAGAGLGAIGASNDDNGFDKIDHAATAGLAVVGAGVGALTGYLIGRRGSKRILVYESN